MTDLRGPVEVVGVGLLGTSIGLVCRRIGLDVVLRDVDPGNVRTATGLGAGRPAGPDDRPQLVVVAVPPEAVGPAVVDALGRSDAVVTDVGSIKSRPLEHVAATVAPAMLARYVGSHPMAGSERSGPLAASAALFDGRPWAVTAHDAAAPEAVALVEQLVLECGASPVAMTPAEHDQAVARISHLPHLLSALVAARLVDAPSSQLALSGQGVRDVTRVAASDPAMWRQIIQANSGALLGLLEDVRDDLVRLIDAVATGESGSVTDLLERGNAGTRAIPGKHGGPVRPMGSVFVAISDKPGELARLFADAGDIGVNIEDVRIDHDPSRPGGLTEIVVADTAVDLLVGALESRGWVTHR